MCVGVRIEEGAMPAKSLKDERARFFEGPTGPAAAKRPNAFPGERTFKIALRSEVQSTHSHL